MRRFARSVKSQKLVRHVLQRFADAGLARVPARAAQLVERWVRPLDDAIALHQVHALEWHVEARIVGIAEQHELAAMAVRFDLTEAFELADAVIDVNDEVAGLKFGEISEKSRSANFVAGALDSWRDVEKIGVAKNRKL